MRTKILLSLIALVSFAAESFAQPITPVSLPPSSVASTTQVRQRGMAAPFTAGTSLPRTYDFGTSCAGTPVGSALISEDPTTSADIGDTYTLKLTGAPANTPVVLNIDDASLVWQGISLPFNMAPLGAPGCVAYVAPVVSYWTTTDANGDASISVNIPNNSALDGLRLNAQWMVVQAGRNPLGVTATNAFSFVLRMPIVLRSVIGPNNSSTNGLALVSMDNTQPYSSSVYYSVPLPVQAPVAARIKKIRFIGGSTVNSAPFPSGSADVNVWSSLSNAIANPMIGDVFQGWLAAPYSLTTWGSSMYNTPTFEFNYNAMSAFASVTLQPGVPYFVGISIETGGNFADIGVSDTQLPSCAANTLVGPSHPNGFLIQGPGVVSGCVAADVIATAIY